jgi:hypothetical protein
MRPFFLLLSIVCFLSSSVDAQILKDIKKAKDKVATVAFDKLSRDPVTTSFKDVDKTLYIEDDYGNDEVYTDLTKEKFDSEKGYFLYPGFYEGVFESFCLKAGTPAPSGGNGRFYADLKGPKADIIKHILQRHQDDTSIEQWDVQLLLWAIIAKCDFQKMAGRVKETAIKMLSPKQIARLSKGSLEALGENQLKKMSYKSDALRAVIIAENKMRSMYYQGIDSYEDYEEIAMTTGIEPFNSLYTEGRWIKHPDGYYIRYYTPYASQTTTQLYIPEDLSGGVYYNAIDDIAVPSHNGAQRLIQTNNPYGTNGWGGADEDLDDQQVVYWKVSWDHLVSWKQLDNVGAGGTRDEIAAKGRCLLYIPNKGSDEPMLVEPINFGPNNLESYWEYNSQNPITLKEKQIYSFWGPDMIFKIDAEKYGYQNFGELKDKGYFEFYSITQDDPLDFMIQPPLPDFQTKPTSTIYLKDAVQHELYPNFLGNMNDEEKPNLLKSSFGVRGIAISSKPIRESKIPWQEVDDRTFGTFRFGIEKIAAFRVRDGFLNRAWEIYGEIEVELNIIHGLTGEIVTKSSLDGDTYLFNVAEGNSIKIRQGDVYTVRNAEKFFTVNAQDYGYTLLKDLMPNAYFTVKYLLSDDELIDDWLLWNHYGFNVYLTQRFEKLSIQDIQTKRWDKPYQNLIYHETYGDHIGLSWSMGLVDE